MDWRCWEVEEAAVPLRVRAPLYHSSNLGQRLHHHLVEETLHRRETFHHRTTAGSGCVAKCHNLPGPAASCRQAMERRTAERDRICEAFTPHCSGDDKPHWKCREKPWLDPDTGPGGLPK